MKIPHDGLALDRQPQGGGELVVRADPGSASAVVRVFLDLLPNVDPDQNGHGSPQKMRSVAGTWCTASPSAVTKSS